MDKTQQSYILDYTVVIKEIKITITDKTVLIKNAFAI